MTVGVVVREPVVEPEDPSRRRARRAAACAASSSVQPRVACIAEQALARRQDRALAVDLERAALERRARSRTTGARAPRRSRMPSSASPWKRYFSAPAVEAERARREVAARVAYEDGRDVARPQIAERERVERDREIAKSRSGVGLVRRVGDEQVDDLAARDAGLRIGIEDGARERHELDPRGDEVRAPVVEVRPREPARGVRLPLGGLAKARGTRRGHEGRSMRCTAALGNGPGTLR